MAPPLQGAVERLRPQELKRLKFQLSYLPAPDRLPAGLLAQAHDGPALLRLLQFHLGPRAPDALQRALEATPGLRAPVFLPGPYPDPNNLLPPGNKRKRLDQCDQDEPKRYDMSKCREAFLMGVKKGRSGATQDIEKLRKHLAAFRFSVQECIDPDGKEILQDLRAFRDKINGSPYEMSCCLVVLMSHGVDGFIKGKDEEEVNLEEIFKLFNNANCPNLREKPKIFIIQACRGDRRDGGVEAFDNVAEEMDDTSNVKRLPTTSDFFIVYSTQKGHVSVRNPLLGSRMIEAIDDVFSRYGNKWQLTDLFTKVNDELVHRDFYGFQCVVKVTLEMQSTLTRAVYLASEQDL
ncbi:caspase-14-like [Tachyglossus aculeatus]|uniref:caspase-14-like n=1 Tax=Tachyglossus aculeatus TaxID=9261 RepID=UPI0018F28B9F|nr:caspase-14-like [Tachyglossus aculeatus]